MAGEQNKMNVSISDYVFARSSPTDFRRTIVIMLRSLKMRGIAHASVSYEPKAARSPTRDLNGFDFASSEINEALAGQVHLCEFIDDR